MAAAEVLALAAVPAKKRGRDSKFLSPYSTCVKKKKNYRVVEEEDFKLNQPTPSPYRQAEEARQQILNQILHPEAADRLGRIRLVKEQRATDVENRLITLAQTGQLRQKVTEEQLKELLTAVADNEQHEKIVVSRRKGWDDDDDDLLDL